MANAHHRRIPPAESCVTRPMLEKWSASQPEKVFVKVSKTEEVTYRQMRDLAAATAAGLYRLGVRQGDNVIVWMPNTVDCMRVWFGINWLGATYVPINTAYKGHLLEHVLKNAGARIIVAHASLAGLLTQVDTSEIETVVVFGGDPIAISDLRVLPSHVLDEGEESTLPDIDVKPWDMQSIIYTSGTTGPSKGVMSSYAHLHAMSGPDAFYMVTQEDRICAISRFSMSEEPFP
jgi:crotonobetaine/carnitine-CoA ligase